MAKRRRQNGYFPRKQTPTSRIRQRRYMRYAAKPGFKFTAGYDRTGGYYGRYSGRNAELKFWDVDLDDAVVAVAGTITDSINLIPQNVTESGRIGRKCTIRYINWRWDLVLPKAADGNGSSDVVRIIMYKDKQCNGAAATAALILQTDDYQSFNNLAEKGRFRILYDKTIDLAANGLGALAGPVTITGESTFSGSFYKRCTIPLEFSGVTGAITELRSNNLGVLLLSKTGLSGFASKLRLRFSDGQ